MGFDTSDDACVYRLRDDLAVIQTVDFFPPMVDDPYAFGQIAAANALSDIYAMGAKPSLAMNLLCYPTCLAQETVQAILAGGYEKVKEAGAVIAGGHTIQDPEPKYGLCVSGFADPAKILRNSGAQPGDLLILTKPLGIGVMTTAAKADLLTAAEFSPAIESMSMLNRAACECMLRFPVHACTDVTGFGLLGILPAGAYENMRYMQGKVTYRGKVARVLRDLIADPQTSGGLLIALSAAPARKLCERLANEVTPWARIVGEVVDHGENTVIVE